MVLARALRDAHEEARSLAPVGEAWTRDPRSTWDALLAGLSVWRARVDVRAEELLQEFDPRTSTELLPEWEAAVGLPDECLPAPASLAERRGLVVSRLVGEGGGSRAFFIALARAVGFEVTITEGVGSPFRMGVGRMGDRIGGELEFFTWTVNGPETAIRRAAMGSFRMGDPLASWGNELLECVIQRAAPAHTLVLFSYEASGGPTTCWITVLDENGAAVAVYEVGTSLVFLDELGQSVQVVVTPGGTVEVLDENGAPVDVPVTCAP